jgi:hypothetical protein
MNTASLWRKPALALVLAAGALAAHAQGGITPPPNKDGGATSQPATGTTPTVTGPSTISVAPKKTHKAIAKANAASAAASK